MTTHNPSIVNNLIASATGTTTAIAATLTAVPGKVTYLSGFLMNAGATTATNVAGSITGLQGGTINFLQPVGATTPVVFSITFNPAIPASAPNTSIVVNTGAAGTGGTQSVIAYGYQI